MHRKGFELPTRVTPFSRVDPDRALTPTTLRDGPTGHVEAVIVSQVHKESEVRPIKLLLGFLLSPADLAASSPNPRTIWGVRTNQKPLGLEAARTACERLRNDEVTAGGRSEPVIRGQIDEKLTNRFGETH
jgi:hypothetical protein